MALDNSACDAGMWEGAEMQGQNRAWDAGNPRNLYGQDSEPASMAFIHSIYGQGYAAFIHSDHGQGHSVFSYAALFASTGEGLGGPHLRMSLRLRDLSHEGMAIWRRG